MRLDQVARRWIAAVTFVARDAFGLMARELPFVKTGAQLQRLLQSAVATDASVFFRPGLLRLCLRLPS